MCAGLAAHGLQLTDINNVVLTHRGVDSMGNLNLFYATRILVGNQQIVRDTVFEQTRPPQYVSGVLVCVCDWAAHCAATNHPIAIT